MVNYYELLGLQPPAAGEAATTAFAEQLKQRYRLLIRGSHPDRAGAESKLDPAVLNAAHDTLADPAARAAYDEKLALQGRLNDNAQQTTLLAQCFDNHFDWLKVLCDLTQAVRGKTRGLFSRQASDKELAEIRLAAQNNDEKTLKGLLVDFANSGRWDKTSTRTLFFNLFIINRRSADRAVLQAEAIACVAACTEKSFAAPVVIAAEKKADEEGLARSDFLAEYMQQLAAQLPSMSIQMGFLRHYMGDDKAVKNELFQQLWKKSTEIKAQIEALSAQNRLYQERLATVEPDKQAEAKELIQALLRMHIQQQTDGMDMSVAIVALDEQLDKLKTSEPVSSPRC